MNTACDIVSFHDIDKVGRAWRPDTDDGPANVEFGEFERNWAQVVVAKYTHPRTGEVVAKAWRSYR